MSENNNRYEVLNEKQIDSLFEDVEWYEDEIAIDSCNADNAQERQTSQYNEEELINLANSIRTQGLQNRIQLSPDPSVKRQYIVMAGQSRLNAYKKLAEMGDEGFKKIPARISKEPLTENQRMVLSSTENNQRKETSREDKTAHYRKIYDVVGNDLALAARICSVHQNTIIKYVRLAAVPSQAAKYFSDRGIAMNFVIEAYEALPPQARDYSDDKILEIMIPIVTNYQNTATPAERRKISKTIQTNQPTTGEEATKALERSGKSNPIIIEISLYPNEHEGIKEMADEQDKNVEDYVYDLIVTNLQESGRD